MAERTHDHEAASNTEPIYADPYTRITWLRERLDDLRRTTYDATPVDCLISELREVFECARGGTMTRKLDSLTLVAPEDAVKPFQGRRFSILTSLTHFPFNPAFSST